MILTSGGFNSCSTNDYALRRSPQFSPLLSTLVLVPISAAVASATTPPVKLLSCTNTEVFKPTSFVISCADANSELTATHWSTWNASSATGTTRFALNLCVPYCAASKMSYFPKSTVRLADPVTTKHGRLFSSLVVRYQLKGKSKTFSFSWKGDPSF